jgi:RNA polymerase sigma-70 factor (ECF subfamily)
MAEAGPHLPGLYRTALRLTRDPTRAEDLVQDAILKGFRFFDSYRPGTNFAAWIHRVLYTVFLNTARGAPPRSAPIDLVPEPERPRRSALDDLGLLSPSERTRGVLEQVDDRIKRAVEALPEELRLTFLLNTVEGLKYREIAEVMDCPIGTVMSRLFRARQLLQSELRDHALELGFAGAALDEVEGP